MTCDSPLKWVGGKSKLIPRLVQPGRLNGSFGDYHEPFLGGGSVLCALLQPGAPVQVTGTYYASDANAALIGFYQCLQRDVEGLIQALEPLCAAYHGLPPVVRVAGSERRTNRSPVAASLTEATHGTRDDVYYWARQEFNKYTTAPGAGVDDMSVPVVAALFLFLNKTGYRGLYRTSANGFNVPYGHYARPSVYCATKLRALSSVLQSRPVVFRCESFDVALARVSDDALVYADPPYVPVKTESFVGYTSEGFDADATERLFQWCANACHLPGTRVVMSNSAAPVVRQMLDAMPGITYETCECRRAIHSTNPAARETEVVAWTTGNETETEAVVETEASVDEEEGHHHAV